MNDPLDPFREEIVSEIDRIRHLLGLEATPSFEVPPQDMGDLALPCFTLSRSPSDIASSIASEFRGKLNSAEAVGPYVNFTMHRPELYRFTLRTLSDLREKYGTLPSSGIRVILEHTSANPNGPLHVGRARNPIIGDALARVMRAAGYDVTTEYYVNDVGKQVAVLAWGMKHISEDDLPPPERDKTDHLLVRYYQRAYSMMEAEPDVESQIDSMLSAMEGGDASVMGVVRSSAQEVLKGMLESLKRMGVVIDSLAWESRFIEDGSVERVISRLEASRLCREEDGALYLDLSEFGIHGRSTKFFFTRKGRVSLYTTRDIAYHLDKFSRSDLVVNVLGEDHRLQARQLEIALQEMGVERRPEVIFYAFVSLPGGKMSTRRGRVVYLDDLMDEAEARAYEEVTRRRPEMPEEERRRIARAVGIGAIRYNMVMVRPEKKIVFRWEDALNFEGDSGPFLQYAYARASNILKRAGRFEMNFDFMPDVDESRLLEEIARFPSSVRRAAEQRKPHLLADFMHRFASAFNAYYRDCPVLSSDRRCERLTLTWAARIVLGRGLDLLGLERTESI